MTAVRPGAVTLRDYDFRRPLLPLIATANVPTGEVDVDVSANVSLNTSGLDVSASASVSATYEPAGLELYSHRGDFDEPEVSTARARTELEQFRRERVVAEGSSHCRGMLPGVQFTLDAGEGPLSGPYAITRVDHEGTAPRFAQNKHAIYENRFQCVPADVPFRPKQPKPVLRQVLESALVVGPRGEEIHTDSLGRIKVQFHWDREGARDEFSSCWVRVIQTWSGAGWGTQFIPRIGMEVMVSFLNGDQDCPIVMGCVPNAIQPPPFILPGDKTRSGFKTQSSPGGGGFNELSFEDAKAEEQIFLHAQRDLDEVVERNHSLLVRNNELLKILGSRVDRIEKDLAVQIGGDHSVEVTGSRVDVVSGNSDARVSGASTTRVGGKERRNIVGQSDHEYGEDLTTRVLGCVTTLVGKTGKKRSWVTHAEGTAELSSSDGTRLSSDKELVLAVGKSSIRISADKIEFSAPAVAMTGDGGGLAVSSDGISIKSKDGGRILLDKQILVKTADEASISLGKQIKADGKEILLNSPSEADDPPSKDPGPPTSISLKDQDGVPLGYQRYLLTLDDGSQFSGMTDKDGSAEHELTMGGTVVFPDLSMPGDTPTGATTPYVIRQGDYLDKLAFVLGFDASEVWNDPQNARLSELGRTPNLLQPGDVLNVPVTKREAQRFQVGSPNSYTADVPKVEVALVFRAPAGAIGLEAYVIEGAGAPLEGITEADGTLKVRLAVFLREITISFPRLDLIYAVRLGEMDPLDEVSGYRKRLANLGHIRSHSAEIGDTLADRAAILSFQERAGLPTTGEMDDATRVRLLDAHGS
jgi:type VI secretion system secreted protein VgrG